MAEEGEQRHAQRREYVRSHTAPVEIELRFGVTPRTGWLIDVSEGGLRFSVRDDLARDQLLPEIGDRVEVELPIGGEPLDLDAELIQVERQKDRWVLGARFVGIPVAAADRIRAYVFERQRRERRRDAGLG
jgi:c-di-GMP-binding flagellar brake protein YcgR